jgi:hypothetical protein
MSEDRKKASEEIKKMSDENGGKIFMGMVHHMYGPLRGLNFILDTPNVEAVMNAMDSQEVQMDPVEQMKRATEIKTKDPNDVVDICFKVWTETGLAVRLMVLPFEMADQAENYPNSVKSIEGGIKEINSIVKMTAPLQSKDPFFYRVGII